MVAWLKHPENTSSFSSYSYYVSACGFSGSLVSHSPFFILDTVTTARTLGNLSGYWRPTLLGYLVDLQDP